MNSNGRIAGWTCPAACAGVLRDGLRVAWMAIAVAGCATEGLVRQQIQFDSPGGRPGSAVAGAAVRPRPANAPAVVAHSPIFADQIGGEPDAPVPSAAPATPPTEASTTPTANGAPVSNPAAATPIDTAPATSAAPAATGPLSPEAETLKKLSLEDLMNVEVTSVSRQESTVGQSPAAITVISPEMIRRSGATTIPELFRMVPGMDVARLDTNKWAIGVRGFNQRFQNDLLVQIDGRTLYNPIFSGVYWDTVDYPLEDIERIEVVRGPGASVWGANAVNGVINIITKPAQETQGGRIVGGAGTAEEGFGEIRYGGKLGDNAYYRIYGKGFTRDDAFALKTATTPDGDPHDAWTAGRGGFRIDWPKSPQDTFTVSGDYFHDDAQRVDARPQLFPPFSFRNVESEYSDGGNLLARWNHQTDRESGWSLQIYGDHLQRSSTNNVLDLRSDTFDMDFQQQFLIGDNQKFIYGLGYRFIDAFINNSGRDNGFSLARAENPNNVFSLFVQDQIALVPDKLSVILGTKVEHNEITGFEYEPSGRLLWTPTPRQTVWAGVSRAVRTPSLTENEPAFHNIFPSATTVFRGQAGDTAFKSEDLLAFEAGYRTQVSAAISLDTALYYNVYNNLRVLVPGAPRDLAVPAGGSFIPLLPQNRMDGKTFGVEVGANLKLSEWWRLYGAYTFEEIQLHPSPDLSAGTRAGAKALEGQSPENQFYLQSSWDLPHDVEFDLIARFVDRITGFNPSGTPGSPDRINAYIAVDARLSWRPTKNLELTLVGQNLFDNHHPEEGTSPLVRSPIVQIPRGVYGSITYRW